MYLIYIYVARLPQAPSFVTPKIEFTIKMSFLTFNRSWSCNLTLKHFRAVPSARVCEWVCFENNQYRSHRSISTSRDYKTSSFHYLKPLLLYNTIKPYHINLPVSALPGLQSNEESALHEDVPVHNARSYNGFDLNIHGFQIFDESPKCTTDHQESKESLSQCLSYEDSYDSELVRSVYRRGVENFIKKAFGAEICYAFTHEVRHVRR
jgi:hypothetical protein